MSLKIIISSCGIISKLSSLHVLITIMIGILLTTTMNEGAMRILLPLFVIIAGILVCGLTCLIAKKSDHR